MSRRTELVITQQGAVRVNEATIFAESERIACVDVDLHTKYAETFAASSGSDGTQTVVLTTTDRCLNLHPDHPIELTHVDFPEFKGWTLYACSGPSRYTLRVVFVKEEEK